MHNITNGTVSDKTLTHIIVAHGTQAPMGSIVGDNERKGAASAAVVVSQQWVEASRIVGCVLDPEMCPILAPLPRTLPYPSMRGITICFTGLSLQKLFLYTLLARDIGATVTNKYKNSKQKKQTNKQTNN